MLHKIRWTPQKIAQRINLIKPFVYKQSSPLPPFRFKALSSPLDHPPIEANVDDSGWQTIEPRTYWGAWGLNFVMRTHFEVPSDWPKNAPIGLYLPLGDSRNFSHPETLAYIDGQAWAGADRHHHEIRLPDTWRDGKPHLLALHGYTGRENPSEYQIEDKLYMRECAVVLIDQPTRDLVALAEVALDVAGHLDDNHTAKGRLYNALETAFVTLDTRDPMGTAAFYDSVPAALKALQKGIAAAGEAMDVDVIGVGHAHIDVAWLWTLGQTVRKSGRTFSTVLRLMEEFPEYTFSQSQPQLYKYTEQHYPELFEQIKQRVKEGRWETMGGTWVEPDCNAIGAESLARQFLLGRGYYRKHFGDVDTPVLWLPDTFGYSWALPQLIKQAGMKYFITHKMSWNQYNQMPNQILWWQGLDGTRVLTHFLTTLTGDEFLPFSTTYNGLVSAKEVFGTWENFRQKETHNELITAYGYGDGGGGPTREMIQSIQAMKEHPGTPRLRFGTVREFMERIENEIAEALPTWNGEFYLEYHRGTYTSQARTKRNNRKSEFLLHDAEFLAAMASAMTGAAYPHEAINQAWELVCLNQFHDILPGSSIGPVYEDSERDFATVRQLGEKVREDAVSALANTLPAQAAVAVINPTSFGGRKLGLLEGTAKDGALIDLRTNTPLATQAVDGGLLVDVPALEPYSVLGLAESTSPAASQSDGVSAKSEGQTYILENAVLRVELNKGGDITRIYDKEAGREVLSPGETGNALLAFEDRPMNYDAWDIDIYYEDRTEKVEGVESIGLIENGPLRAGLEIKRTYRNSRIHQKIYLYRESKRLDFDTWIDWHDSHILLKAAFPVDVLNPLASFDVQWGNVQRSTHRNTSWDWGRFETCAHKWADLSEGDYGVALLNDCKYGYDIHNNVMRLSLLKSATSPDAHADQGEHFMTYSLLPHRGDWREHVIPEAYALNDPLILRRVQGGSNTNGGAAFVSVDQPNIVIETVKQAEDGNGVIVRMYEDHRSRGTVTLTAGFDLAEAHHANLLEENQTALDVSGKQVRLSFRPYEIITLRLVPAG